MARHPHGKRHADADGKVSVHGKVANGEGSVYYAADGRWRATYRVPGEKRPRQVSGQTRDKVIAKRDAAAAAAKVASPAGSSFTRAATVGQLSLWWLHNVHRHRVRPSTWAKAQDRVNRIVATLGTMPVIDMRVEHVANWQAALLKEPLAPRTVAHHRQTLAQVFDQAIEMGLVASNPVRRVKPPRVERSSAPTLDVAESLRLIGAAASDRYGAVVALLFLQGWRISEALGLAWEDLDLEAGTAIVRRACIYIDHVGPTLAPTKTPGALGEHQLLPPVVDALQRQHATQTAERLAVATPWATHTYQKQPVNLVFTTPTGGLVLRQTVAKTIIAAATAAGLEPAGIGTQGGRRSVITALYAQGGESIDEIARFIGHASPATTAGYVRDLGDRPAAFAKRAAALYDEPGL